MVTETQNSKLLEQLKTEYREGYDEGYVDGKEKAYEEVVRVAQRGTHKDICDCYPCDVIRKVRAI